AGTGPMLAWWRDRVLAFTQNVDPGESAALEAAVLAQIEMVATPGTDDWRDRHAQVSRHLAVEVHDDEPAHAAGDDSDPGIRAPPEPGANLLFRCRSVPESAPLSCAEGVLQRPVMRLLVPLDGKGLPTKLFVEEGGFERGSARAGHAAHASGS